MKENYNQYYTSSLFKIDNIIDYSKKTTFINIFTNEDIEIFNKINDKIVIYNNYLYFFNYLNNINKIIQSNVIIYSDNSKIRKYLIDNGIIPRNIKKKRYIGDEEVNNINDVKFDYLDKKEHLIKGVSLLIRVKNEINNIKLCIESAINIPDEIIVIDNGSTDGTYEELKKLESIYSTLYVYRYNIVIPRVGDENYNSLINNDKNSISTFYNWGMSKVRTYNVMKWDADFVCIQRNLIKLIDDYNLHNRDDKISIWFTGITCFYGKVYNLKSYYDEFRIYSRLNGAKWKNANRCESIGNYVSSCKKLYINGYNDTNYKLNESYNVKKPFIPVFIEQKDYDDYKPKQNIIDKRDTNDNIIIEKYNYLHNSVNYLQPNYINNVKVIIVIPSFGIGGGNYFGEILYKLFDDMGISVKIAVRTKKNNFHKRIKDNDIILYNESNINSNEFTHLIATIPININLKNKSCKKFILTHSDVSWINNFILNNTDYYPLFLNEITKRKFNERNVYGSILYNYLENSSVVNNKVFDKNNIKMLYCNRISPDKNLLMLIVLYKKIIEIYPNIVLTILAGGSLDNGNISYEFKLIKNYINYFNIPEKNLILLNDTKDTLNYYLENDFCILCSVSEGCSYNLLESINYEVPIIHTNILPHNEITNGKMPSITFDGLIEFNDMLFSINDYNEYNKKIGYIMSNELCKKCYINYKKIISKVYNEENIYINIPIIPIIIKCNICNKLQTERSNIFNKNVNRFTESIINMIENFDKYKKNISEIKKKKIYHFSKSEYYKNLLNIMFRENEYIL
jgi:glycosyltransferase involved in cell wall biosynthesis